MFFYFAILPFCPFAKSICFQKAFPNFNYGNNSSLAFTQVYSILLKCKVREAVRRKKAEHILKVKKEVGEGEYIRTLKISWWYSLIQQKWKKANVTEKISENFPMLCFICHIGKPREKF